MMKKLLLTIAILGFASQTLCATPNNPIEDVKKNPGDATIKKEVHGFCPFATTLSEEKKKQLAVDWIDALRNWCIKTEGLNCKVSSLIDLQINFIGGSSIQAFEKIAKTKKATTDFCSLAAGLSEKERGQLSVDWHDALVNWCIKTKGFDPHACKVEGLKDLQIKFILHYLSKQD